MFACHLCWTKNVIPVTQAKASDKARRVLGSSGRREMGNEKTATVIRLHQHNFPDSEITSPFQTATDKKKFISINNEKMQTNFTYFNYMMKCKIRTPLNERTIYQMCHEYKSYIFIGMYMYVCCIIWSDASHNARTEWDRCSCLIF